MPDKPEALKVFISNPESVCSECHKTLGSQAFVKVNGQTQSK
jgi:hypothetical protein